MTDVTGVAIRSPFSIFVVRMRKGMRIATPVCALARNDILDYTGKKEPGVPKGWKDYHPGEGSHCPWGHPHKFLFVKRLSKTDEHIPKIFEKGLDSHLAS